MRMRKNISDRHDARRGGQYRSSVHVSAISELSGGRDQQLGQIFRNMRLAMRLSREALARRLATTALIVDNFEAGAITALPHWKETERIVRGYCQLLRLDPEPILWRIQSQLQQATATHARPIQAGPSSPPRVLAARSQRASSTSAEPARTRRRARMLFALSAPVAVAAAVVYLAQMVPQPLYHTIALLPGPVAKPVRTGLDYLLVLTAPSRDGLKWIDVSDPQLRKADKLSTSTP